MKRLFKFLAWTLLFLVVTSGVWIGSIAIGWAAVPKFVTDLVAKVKGLTDTQAAQLHRAVNLYRVIKNSPEAPMLAEALSLFAAGKTSAASNWA